MPEANSCVKEEVFTRIREGAARALAGAACFGGDLVSAPPQQQKQQCAVAARQEERVF